MMKILLIAALIIMFASAIRDQRYIELLEAEINMRDIIIKEYEDKDNKK